MRLGKPNEPPSLLSIAEDRRWRRLAEDMTAAGVNEIEDDIPIPPVMRARSRMRDLKVGQSFLITNYTREDSVRELAYQIGVQLGRKFTVRQMSEGVRVWRIK